jgi:protein-S-isoprenylcysteine O-methyltransferase Ste14
MTNFVGHIAVATSAILGGGGLLLFAYFLVFGPATVVDLHLTPVQRLVWDGFLSLLFFLQHSAMVRRSVRGWTTRVVPDELYPAVYSIASGLTLLVAVLFWQPSEAVIYSAPALAPWLPLLIAAITGAAGVWSVRALRAFDPFGISDARAYARNKERHSAPLTIRGPYRYVRHPLYLLMLVLFWCQPTVTADRLLFNVLWTAWIIVATRLEERDLRDVFGESYRRYQSEVPMLLPWRIPTTRSSTQTPQ